MNLPENSLSLRIYIDEADRWEGRPMHEAIVTKARDQHLAGATVFRSPMGFGASSHMHTAKILRLSDNLPIIIEIVDSEEKINAFVPVIEGMVDGGLITLHNVKVLHYRGRTTPT